MRGAVLRPLLTVRFALCRVALVVVLRAGAFFVFFLAGAGGFFFLQGRPPPPAPPPPEAMTYLAFLWCIALAGLHVLLFALTGFLVDLGPFDRWPRLAVAPLVFALCHFAFFWHMA